MKTTLPTKSVAVAAALVTAGTFLVAAPAAEAAGRGVTHVHVTKKHTVIAPARVRPGLVHLHNDGKRPIAIFRKKHDGVAALVKYANAESEKTGRKIFTRFDFVELAQGRGDDYVRLSRGTYYLVDAGASKVKPSGVTAVTVQGKRSNAVRPRTTRNLTISGRGTVRGATTGKAKTYLRVRNNTAAPRLVEALKIKSSATPAQVRAVLDKPSDDALYDLVDLSGFNLTTYLGARQDVTTRTQLGRGRYFVLTVNLYKFGGRLRPGYVHLLTLD